MLPYPLRYDGEWHVDLAALREAASDPRVRAVLAIHPNNPTGNYLERSELSALTALCAQRQLAFICDEVFFDFPIDPESAEKRSHAGHAHQGSPCLTFTLGGLSKSVGWPQLKLGFLIADGPAPLVHEALERLTLIADSFLSVGSPIEAALPSVLHRAPHFPGTRPRAPVAQPRPPPRRLTRQTLGSATGRRGLERDPARPFHPDE